MEMSVGMRFKSGRLVHSSAWGMGKGTDVSE